VLRTDTGPQEDAPNHAEESEDPDYEPPSSQQRAAGHSG
jgi:hypothetical protein